MDIDDLATVFHMGEKLFTAHKVPNLYRTWDEFEVVDLYYSSPDFCLVAEHEEQVVGFALGTTIEKSHSAWKYGHLIWLGVDPSVQSKGVGEKLCAHMEENHATKMGCASSWWTPRRTTPVPSNSLSAWALASPRSMYT